MPKTKPTYQIPFDAAGDMMNYVSYKTPETWKDIYEFRSQLTVHELHRGRSSVTVEMRDSADHVFWLSIAEFMRLVKEYTLVKGKLPTLWWTFKKQGSAYFIYELQPDPEVKKAIDGMSQLEMARMVRFAPIGDVIFLGATGTYFHKVFKEKGGMTTAVSKEIGWGLEAVNSKDYRSGMCLAVLGNDATGEYRCGRRATHHTRSRFWTNSGIEEKLTEREQREQPVCLEHAQRVDKYWAGVKSGESETCVAFDEEGKE
jgi:hypothetical protein